MKTQVQRIGEWIEHHKIATFLIMVFILAAALGIRQIYWEYKIATRKPNIRTMADQSAIRAAIRIDGDSVEGFSLSFDASGMIELMPAFEKENSYGNGPAWEGIAEYLISQRQGLEGIDLQSEGDALLAVCMRREPLEKLQAILLEVAADEQRLREVIRHARAGGFGHGDL